MSASTIYHVAHRVDFDEATRQGHYRCSSLDTEGFIHCCMAEQFGGVISRYYLNQTGLLILTILVAELDQPPVWENTSGGTELFPHLYYPLNISAIEKSEALDTRALPDLPRREAERRTKKTD